MKQTFIQNLKNGQVPFLENEQALSELPSNLFEPFNANLVTLEKYEHRWNEEYFNAKAMDLEINFSKELVLHLIAVKKSLQAKNPVPNMANSTVEVPIISAVQSEPVVQVEPEQAVKKQDNFAKPDLVNFRPNEKLSQFLSEGDLSKIRSYLMSMLNNRRLSLEEVFKSIWYVYQNKAAVFEVEEENAFVQAMDKNEANWNVSYFNQQQVYLNKNFSLARLLHLANVRETLMKKGVEEFQQIKVKQPEPKVQTHQEKVTHYSETQSAHKTENRQQTVQHTSTSESENTFVKTLMIVGGAILALGLALLAILK